MDNWINDLEAYPRVKTHWSKQSNMWGATPTMKDESSTKLGVNHIFEAIPRVKTMRVAWQHPWMHYEMISNIITQEQALAHQS